MKILLICGKYIRPNTTVTKRHSHFFPRHSNSSFFAYLSFQRRYNTSFHRKKRGFLNVFFVNFLKFFGNLREFELAKLRADIRVSPSILIVIHVSTLSSFSASSADGCAVYRMAARDGRGVQRSPRKTPKIFVKMTKNTLDNPRYFRGKELL